MGIFGRKKRKTASRATGDVTIQKVTEGKSKTKVLADPSKGGMVKKTKVKTKIRDGKVQKVVKTKERKQNIFDKLQRKKMFKKRDKQQTGPKDARNLAYGGKMKDKFGMGGKLAADSNYDLLDRQSN